MKSMKIPFSPPDMSEEEAKEVREAIQCPCQCQIRHKLLRL